jgi:hypothetical protein
MRRQLQRAEEDAASGQRLRDEMEELRERCALVAQLEKRCELYQQRLDTMASAASEVGGFSLIFLYGGKFIHKKKHKITALLCFVGQSTRSCQ